jgi:hypothetical protein
LLFQNIQFKIKKFMARLPSETFTDFYSDVVENSSKAVSDSFNSSNVNGTMGAVTAGLGCSLCFAMIKYNVVPLATLATCIGCSIFVAAPTYKSVKAVIKAPFEGF